jgi:hypothetical protein
LNRRAVVLGVAAAACAPAETGERFEGVLRLGFDEALFWPQGRDDGPWQVAASAPVMKAIEAAVKAANGGFAFGGIVVSLIGRLDPPPAAGQPAPRKLTVLKLLRSSPESFTVRG